MTIDHYYRIGGLVARSNHEIRNAHPAPDQERRYADLTISFRQQPFQPLPEWKRLSPFVSGNKFQIFFSVPGVADFLVTRGHSIEIHAAPGSPWNSIELYLLGSAMGVIYHQRHTQPLHAACVTNGDSAIALAGDSGEGKSTLAYVMSLRDYDLLTDDLAPITQHGDTILVHREKPTFKIWKQTADHFSVPVDGLDAVSNRDDKYYLPARHSRVETCPLKALVILATDQRCHRPTLQPVSRLQALAAIRQHTYRNFLLPIIWEEGSFLKHSLRLLEAITIWRLVRPRNLANLEEAADAIQSI